MSTFAADLRAACVDLLTDYAASVNLKLQVYPGRPMSLYPPSAFIDTIREVVQYPGPTLIRRYPVAEVIVIHGTFDSLETVTQRDVFVDGFMDYVRTRYHAAGANSLVAVTGIGDTPTYVPDWLPPEKQRPYFATLISMEAQSE